MRISKISVYQVDLPLRETYWLCGGRLKFEMLDSTFVEIQTQNGLVGWGEGCPWGHTYLPAHGPGVRAGIHTLAPYLIGLNPGNLDHVNRIMDLQLPGHLYAKSALDIACWDIAGQVGDTPLWHMLGGTAATPVPTNSSISTAPADEMVESIDKAREDGYRTHSAKIGGVDAATEINRIETICKSLQPGEYVTFDINRCWSPAMALQVLNSVSTLTWIEQPCETLEQCAYVANRVRQPVLLDECLHNMDDHLRAWKMNACAGLKIKPNRVGGITKARYLRDFALHVGWQVHIEDTGGSSLADTAAIHLASSTPDSNRLDSWLSHRHLVSDPIANVSLQVSDGMAMPPSLPGLGVRPDKQVLGDPVAVYEQ